MSRVPIPNLNLGEAKQAPADSAKEETKGNKSPVEAANEIVELLKSARQISDDIQKNISTLPDLGEYPKINTDEPEDTKKEEKKQ